MVKYIADCSCDVLSVEGVNFVNVPLVISTDERSFLDDANLNVSEMLDYLAQYKGRSYTACPSTETWLDAYEGGTEIYVGVLTSGLSGTYNSACLAKNIYLEDHPDAKIYVIDSLSTSGELRLLMEKVMELKAKGASFEEVCAAIPEYHKHTKLLFAFKSLHNFAQNGRISKVVAGAVGALGISIVGTTTEDGVIEPIGKCRGDKKVIQTLYKNMVEAGYQGGRVNLSHVENEELANIMADKIRKEYPDADINVYPVRGLCSYYAERGGVIVGFEHE